jgi:hypothetical protein
MCQMIVYIALLSQKLCYICFSIKIIYIELIIHIFIYIIYYIYLIIYTQINQD